MPNNREESDCPKVGLCRVHRGRCGEVCTGPKPSWSERVEGNRGDNKKEDSLSDHDCEHKHCFVIMSN